MHGSAKSKADTVKHDARTTPSARGWPSSGRTSSIGRWIRSSRCTPEHLHRLLADVDAKVAAIVTETTLTALPAIDWSWNPADINLILRQMFVAVQLGPDLLPIGAESRLPRSTWHEDRLTTGTACYTRCNFISKGETVGP